MLIRKSGFWCESRDFDASFARRENYFAGQSLVCDKNSQEWYISCTTGWHHVLCESVRFKFRPQNPWKLREKKTVHTETPQSVMPPLCVFLTRSPRFTGLPTSKILSMSFATDMSFSTGRGPKRTCQRFGKNVSYPSSPEASFKKQWKRQRLWQIARVKHLKIWSLHKKRRV